MVFMNTIQLLCRNITAIILLSFIAMFASCDNDDNNINEEPLPEEPQPVERTILAYIWGDIDGESGLVLSNSQLDYINKMEAGWDDSYAGSLYVYIDPSPMFVQFENPVLLKIKHDDTPAIVSEVVKEYEPIGTHGDIGSLSGSTERRPCHSPCEKLWTYAFRTWQRHTPIWPKR